jgi:hypothetical protein
MLPPYEHAGLLPSGVLVILRTGGPLFRSEVAAKAMGAL